VAGSQRSRNDNTSHYEGGTHFSDTPRPTSARANAGCIASTAKLPPPTAEITCQLTTAIRDIVNAALAALSPDFEAL
jgi:hypothetical protein